MTVLSRFAFAVVVLAVARPAFAQAPVGLTLDDAIARAQAHAPRVAEARAREDAADAVTMARAALSKPSVTAQGTFLRTNHVDELGVPQVGGGVRVLFPDVPSNYRLRAELTVPLFTSGRIEGFVDAARADRRAAAADRRAVEMDVRADVTRVYWVLVMARQAEQVLAQALARADASVGDVRSRVDAGVLPPNELLSGQAQRARQAVQLVQARQASALAEMDLARLVGAPPGARLVTTSAVDQPAPAAVELETQSADALIARALERRAEREGLLERQTALQASADAILAAYRPQVAALMAVEPARPNMRFAPRTDEWKTSWDLGVNLTWLVFDGGRARADHAAAIAQAEALSHRVQEFDELVALDVRRRLLDLDSGRAALTASDEAVAAASEARRVVAERFRAGVATSTEVLDAELAQLEAELERTRLQTGQRLAEAALVRAVGGR